MPKQNDIIQVTKTMREYGFTHPSLLQLSLVQEFGDMGFTIPDIAASYGKKPSQLNYSIGALIQRGLLDVSESEIYLSARGRELVSKFPEWAGLSFRLFTDLRLSQIPLTYLALLVEIYRKPGQLAKYYGRQLGVDPSTAYRAIMKLQDAGVIEDYGSEGVCKPLPTTKGYHMYQKLINPKGK